MVTSLSRHPDEHQVTEAPHLYDVCVTLPCSTRRASVTDFIPFSWSQAFQGTLISIRLLKYLIVSMCYTAMWHPTSIGYWFRTNFMVTSYSRPGWQEKNVENIMPLRPVDYSMPLCGSLISHLRMQIFSWSPCLPRMSGVLNAIFMDGTNPEARY